MNNIIFAVKMTANQKLTSWKFASLISSPSNISAQIEFHFSKVGCVFDDQIIEFSLTVINRINNEIGDTSRNVADKVKGAKMFFWKEFQIKPSFTNKEKCSDN